MPAFVDDLSKEELKAALKKIDVDIPTGSNKRETLVDLYKKEVLLTTPTIRTQKSEFSSDEEFPSEESTNRKSNNNSPQKSSQKASLEEKGADQVNGTMDPTNVSQLSDEELGERLLSLGFSPGPIVSSTRRVYERKLLALMRTGGMGDGNVGNEDDVQDEYSDEDEELMDTEEAIEEIPEEPVRQRVIRKTDSPIKRPPLRANTDRYEPEKPKPKEVHSARAPSTATTTKKGGLSIWAKLIIFAVIGVLLYLVYINMDSITAKNIPQITP